jgi:diaminopimelate decarboxylase
MQDHKVAVPVEGAVEPFAGISAVEASMIADAHGTPTFIYDDVRFASSVEALQKIWQATFPVASIYLSYKTNYLPSLCRTAHRLGLGADVVSGYELEHARHLCGNKNIVFNGPMKRRDELRRAAELGALINIDLLEELDILDDLRRKGEISHPRIGVRVNPGAAVFSSPDSSFCEAHKERQRSAKFGWPINDGMAEAVVQRAHDYGFAVSSVHAHLNSQITEVDLHVAALRPVLDFARDIRASGAPLEEINVGGGFGVPGMRRQRRGWLSEMKAQRGEFIDEHEDVTFDMRMFTSELHAELADRHLDDLRISCEPGRYLMSDCMALLGRVAGLKALPDRKWVVIDAGLHIMPTAAFGEQRRLRFFRGDDELTVGADSTMVSLGGPLCYEGDVLMAQVQAPSNLAARDIVMISDAGAYTVSRSTNFNQARASVVIRDGGAGREIWKRETYNDIFTFDTSSS